MRTVRIRLVFEEPHLLSRTQRKDGLKRSWILLKPHLDSVSDFSSHLLDFFLLRDACPDGLILSMDGFILPPFESTSVLKDKDIVRVKKKENVTAVDKIGYGPSHSKTADVVEGQPVHLDVQRLANEEVVKECSDCRNEPDEDEPYDRLPSEDALHAQSDKNAVCRKRKALKALRSSKTKKSSSAPTAKCLLASTYLQQTCTEHNQSFQQDVILSEKSLVKKHKSTNGLSDTDNSNKKNFPKIYCPKKDKRQLIGKQVKAKEQKVQQRMVEKSNRKFPDKNYFKDSEQLAGSSDDEEIVPVVIRPGHIRFEPLGRVANHSVHPAQTSMETLQWNGIISKKGKKWGKEKSLSWKSNRKNYQGESSTLQVTKGLTTENCPIDFDKLRPCASLPKRGDIIAYRLIELSSTWTPELSSFRVGKVSWFKPEAKKIMLIPVPEYPFVFKKVMSGESAIQVDTSPYGDDGSLKADYSSLVDIRIVKRGNSNCFEAAANNISKVSHRNQSWNKWENHANAREDGNENAWDEILLALNAKKSDLSKEVEWSRVEKKVPG